MMSPFYFPRNFAALNGEPMGEKKQTLFDTTTTTEIDRICTNVYVFYFGKGVYGKVGAREIVTTLEERE